MSSECDVIIVGAGAAGLAAAKQLERLGLSYTILEASHRIGGRAYSEEIAPGEWFDLGCAWLVDEDLNPFIEIAGQLGVALSRDKTDEFLLHRHLFVRDGQYLTSDQRVACLKYYDDSSRAIMAAAENGSDIAVCDVLDLDHEFAPPYLTSISTAWGLDVDQLTTGDFGTETGGLGPQVYTGYGNLVAAWGRDVPVQLNCRVDRIDWSGNMVVAETPKGSVTGRCALITVSTGVLGCGDVVFSPDLPVWKSEAIYNLPMGTENKIGVHFDKDVFGDGRGHHTVWTSDGLSCKVDASVMGLSTASVFVGGRFGIWLEQQGHRALSEFAIDRVVDIFGSSIRQNVTRCITTAWESEPMTRGSWACARPGHADKRGELARPVDAKLFFAGEATIYGGQGTCDGAYRSGERAADEIAGTFLDNRTLVSGGRR